MVELKKERLFREMKALVLNSPDGVTRSAVAQYLGVDLRTAAAYLEQLTNSGFAVRRTADARGRGRPVARYFSCCEQLSFLGLVIFQGLRLEAVLIDFQGKILREETVLLAKCPSIFSVFTAILELTKKLRDTEGYRLYGIGLAISRWLQPPLSREDLYCSLAGALKREFGISVCRDVNINAVAYACACERKVRNLAVIHAGLVMEFGLVRAGEPDLRFTEREEWLSHLCVNPEGRRCYCGRRGCLANYVTTDILRERLDAVRQKPEKWNETVRSLGEMLGEGIIRTAWEFPEIELIYVICDPELTAITEEFCMKHNPRPGLLKIELLKKSPSVALGAALESAFFEVNRYFDDFLK